MADDNVLTLDRMADRVATTLREECGVGIDAAGDVIRWILTGCQGEEYRFTGNLGFGGKLYWGNGKVRVGCYPEDRTPERDAAIERANERLEALRQRVTYR